MSTTRLAINLIFILTLVLAGLGNSDMVAQVGNDEALKADPRLLQMAMENPAAVFMVIVQKDAKNRDLKDVVDEFLKGGGAALIHLERRFK